MRIDVVGGGPAGLYFALLVKKFSRNTQVNLFERNPADATYGFGVVLADQGLQHLKAADEESYDQIINSMEMLDEQILHVPKGSIVIDSKRQAGSIARLRLLQILQDCCRRAGVSMHFDHDVGNLDSHLDADLVVAADGVNSQVRSRFAEQFGTTTGWLTNRFAWYGVARGYARPALAFRNYGGGAFVGHYYRYQPDMSTFVVECDEQTWFDLGLDAMTDEERRQLSEAVFAEDLEGCPLQANHSVWRQFPVVENSRWTHQNIVLLGDAQRSVHFSIGSGTRLAMEDAVALFNAFAGAGGDIPLVLQRFEELRRPAVKILADAARASYAWYEDFARKMSLDPLEFAYRYMTRTGRMTDKRLQSYHPGFMARYDALRNSHPAY